MRLHYLADDLTKSGALVLAHVVVDAAQILELEEAMRRLRGELVRRCRLPLSASLLPSEKPAPGYRRCDARSTRHRILRGALGLVDSVPIEVSSVWVESASPLVRARLLEQVLDGIEGGIPAGDYAMVFAARPQIVGSARMRTCLAGPITDPDSAGMAIAELVAMVARQQLELSARPDFPWQIYATAFGRVDQLGFPVEVDVEDLMGCPGCAVPSRPAPAMSLDVTP